MSLILNLGEIPSISWDTFLLDTFVPVLILINIVYLTLISIWEHGFTQAGFLSLTSIHSTDVNKVDGSARKRLKLKRKRKSNNELKKKYKIVSLVEVL